MLAVAACLFYVFVYTLWLKRTSTRNIVIGGAAGAVPVLIGWTSVTGSLGWAPVVLFGVIFFWTPPHFWALAIRYRDDYSAADVPMLPSVASLRTTSARILAYTLVLWALTWSSRRWPAWATSTSGPRSSSAACSPGSPCASCAWATVPATSPSSGSAGDLQLRATAMQTFAWSITYITLLFGAMAARPAAPNGPVTCPCAPHRFEGPAAYVTRFPNRTRPFPQDPR